MNTQGEGILFVQTCFCFQFQPVSSLANLHTCRLYRGSLALAEAESSSGRRPVALLEHLDRTDLKAGGIQASNVVRIPSRNADSLTRFGSIPLPFCHPESSLWLTWIGADFIRSAGHGWQWKIVRERALYSRPYGEGGSQGLYLLSHWWCWWFKDKSQQTPATSYLKESKKTSDVPTCHGQVK